MQRMLFAWLFDQGFPLNIREIEADAGRVDFVDAEVDGEFLPIEAKFVLVQRERDWVEGGVAQVVMLPGVPADGA